MAQIGIDITGIEALQRELIDRICTKEEIERVRGRSTDQTVDPFKIIFSIKESVYKCLFPLVQDFFDFAEVSLELDPGSRSATVHLSTDGVLEKVKLDGPLTARYCVFGDLIFSYVYAPAWSDKRQ